jgi:hypothetical protein
VDILKFFKKIGSSLAKAFNVLVKFVSDADIDEAVDVVQEAAGKFLDNAARREWAVAQVMQRLGVPERIARWIVETAVIEAKERAKAGVEKAGEKAKELND